MRNKVAVIGECMLEISTLANDETTTALPASLSYGGDTLNTAVYLSRMGLSVDYVTALGDDAKSDWMIDQWQREGVGCDLVARREGEVPGLYMIQLDENGERSFLYWRANSPATKLFDEEDKAAALFEALSDYQYIYLSGITLALYSDEARERLFTFLAEYRSKGGQVSFDGNYRPKLWKSTEAAKEAYLKMYSLSDLVMPTDEDEAMLFGEEDGETLIARMVSYGVSEIVLKQGPSGCWVATKDSAELVPSNKVQVVDSTAAGDSFNAGFLGAKLSGKTSIEAAKVAHNLASTVIQHRGAIIPTEAMPAL